MSHVQALKDLMTVIKTVKNYTEAVIGEEDKPKVDKLEETTREAQELASKAVNADSTTEQAAVVAGLIKSAIKLFKPYASDINGLEEALDDLLRVIDGVMKGHEITQLALAIRAFEANPVGACAAAWGGGAVVAKTGIDFVRWVDPNLDTDQATKDIENKVFALVGGGAGGGALIGGIIGGAVGLIGGPGGAAAGAAAGAAIGGGVGSVTGAVLVAL